MKGLRIGLGLAGSMLAAGASGCERGGGQVRTRDSSGVRIVENRGTAWTPGRSWTVIDSPRIDIGGGSEKPEYELDQTRGPVRLGDGRIVLFHGADNELRFYDSTGKYLRSAGRAGSGPGEYQNVTGLWLIPGDSLLLVESFARRLSIVDSAGTYRRSFPVGGAGGQFLVFGAKADAVGPMGRFADGSVLVISQGFAMNQAQSGVYRDSTLAIRYGSDGAVLDTLGSLPAREMEQVPFKLGPETRAAPSPVALGKETLIAVRGDRWAVVRNNAWEIEIRQPTGSLSTLIRAAVQPAPITPADIAAHRSKQLKTIEGMGNLPAFLKQQMRDRTEHAKYPKGLPFFTALLFDVDGNLWAEEATAPAVDVHRWAVLDTVGVWLGRVTIPASFHPTFITSDAVYGIWNDENDVQHVRVYRLRRN